MVPASNLLPAIVTAGTGTVALRAPDHPAALALLRRTGPLAVSSANRSGWDNPVTAADVLAQLGGRIDAVVDGGPCPGAAIDRVRSDPIAAGPAAPRTGG
ncbi:MAG: Sua5/YciO/YrdC/YwlC family protein [Caldilineae bacterium]|nr:Sua5/YciO/YrdC/YwlC family protein [Caldilineae bacterium]